MTKINLNADFVCPVPYFRESTMPYMRGKSVWGRKSRSVLKTKIENSRTYGCEVAKNAIRFGNGCCWWICSSFWVVRQWFNTNVLPRCLRGVCISVSYSVTNYSPRLVLIVMILSRSCQIGWRSPCWGPAKRTRYTTDNNNKHQPWYYRIHIVYRFPDLGLGSLSY